MNSRQLGHLLPERSQTDAASEMVHCVWKTWFGDMVIDVIRLHSCRCRPCVEKKVRLFSSISMRCHKPNEPFFQGENLHDRPDSCLAWAAHAHSQLNPVNLTLHDAVYGSVSFFKTRCDSQRASAHCVAAQQPFHQS